MTRFVLFRGGFNTGRDSKSALTLEQSERILRKPIQIKHKSICRTLNPTVAYLESIYIGRSFLVRLVRRRCPTSCSLSVSDEAFAGNGLLPEAEQEPQTYRVVSRYSEAPHVCLRVSSVST